MDNDISTARSCPTCGVPVPLSARFCPNCGTRLRADTDYGAAGYAGDAYRIDPERAPSDDWEETPPTSTNPVLQDPTWTASARDWNAEPGPTVLEPTESRRNRTLWIILGIMAFIILCCCGLILLTFAVSANDATFQDEISLVLGRLT